MTFYTILSVLGISATALLYAKEKFLQVPKLMYRWGTPPGNSWSAAGMNTRVPKIKGTKAAKPYEFKSLTFPEHNKKIQILLKRAYRSGMSEDTFTQHYQAITGAKGQAISNIRNYYRHLQRKYHFFTVL